MNVWLINPYGPIPGEGWRDYRFTALGRALAERGHSVLWWTANFSHHFKRYRCEDWTDLPVTPRFAIRLVPTTAYRKNVSLGRLRFEAVFCSRMYQRAVHEPSPDCIVGADPPQTAGLTATLLARKHGTPLLLDVLDLWPELFELPFPPWLRPLAPAVLAPLYKLRRYNLHRASAVASMCDTYLEVARNVAPKFRSGNSLLAFDAIDVAAFRESMAGAVEAAELAKKMSKSPGDVWAIYAGSLGNNYDVPTLLEAASRLAGRAPRLRILIAGEGPLRHIVTKAMESARLGNVTYLGVLPHLDLRRIYQVCDLGLSTYAAGSTVAIPVKAYDYMAAGLPVINSLEGEFERLIEARGMGIRYRAGDPGSLADALERLTFDDEGRRRMARNSARAAMEFDTRRQYQNYADFVENMFEQAA